MKSCVICDQPVAGCDHWHELCRDISFGMILTRHTMERLSHEMKYARERRGVSQKALAEAVGIHQPHINMMERQHMIPDDDQLIRLLAWLNQGDTT